MLTPPLASTEAGLWSGSAFVFPVPPGVQDLPSEWMLMKEATPRAKDLFGCCIRLGDIVFKLCFLPSFFLPSTVHPFLGSQCLFQSHPVSAKVSKLICLTMDVVNVFHVVKTHQTPVRLVWSVTSRTEQQQREHWGWGPVTASRIQQGDVQKTGRPTPNTVRPMLQWKVFLVFKRTQVNRGEIRLPKYHWLWLSLGSTKTICNPTPNLKLNYWPFLFSEPSK